MNTKGLSLIELIISLAVFSTVAGLLFGIFFISFKTLGFGERERDAAVEAAWSIERMVKEFRQAHNIYAIEFTNGFYRMEIELAAADGMKRYKYYLYDDPDDSPGSPSYPYQLLRAETTGGWSEGKGKPIAKMVTDFQCEFYDRNNNRITDPPSMESEVREIEIDVKVSKGALGQGTADVELRTRVTGRAL
jgi:prepilin-type N-terminal cleavage/methylation domain-containing protein